MPYQQMPTIADRLIDANVSWAWYSGGWDSAASYPNQSYKDFQYHHQPLLYFETFKDGSANKQKYIRDDKHFFSELNTDSLPAVCFVKPYGALNEHPGYSDLWSGMVYLDSLVNAVMKSKYADSTAIIILSDENGGRWDHVSPPKIDRWGPGTRIPAIIVSKYAHKHHVDHTQYETVSVLKFIETLFGLKPLTNRDANANNLLNAFE
jgi:phospholipase C